MSTAYPLVRKLNPNGKYRNNRTNLRASLKCPVRKKLAAGI
jgi:hypothetical protein